VQYLKTPSEMSELFSDFPNILINTFELSKRCNLHFELFEKNYLPVFPTPKGKSISEFFNEESRLGLKERLKDIKVNEEIYFDRLNFELSVILEMDYPGYFLIVSDFIRWAKENGIPVGPGRGSGAGSLVAWALSITNVDPIAHDLLFERFLNPERISMPDFDIDFCTDRRDEVIAYVASKYGSDKVSQIITYGTMAAKGVVRDVGRVLGHPYGFSDQISKMIPNELKITLEKELFGTLTIASDLIEFILSSLFKLFNLFILALPNFSFESYTGSLTSIETISGILLSIPLILLTLSVLSYGLSILSVGETIIFIIFKKIMDRENILLRNNEEEDSEYPIDDNLDFDSSSHSLLSSTEEEE
jgi:hypothetical protein